MYIYDLEMTIKLIDPIQSKLFTKSIAHRKKDKKLCYMNKLGLNSRPVAIKQHEVAVVK